jgi:hypothetical protein
VISQKGITGRAFLSFPQTSSRHSREGGNPGGEALGWIPAFAGMTRQAQQMVNVFTEIT